MSKVYIALGSNLGNKEDNISRALELLNQHPLIEIKKTSGNYQTKPVNAPGEEDFLNAVVEISTDLQPLALLNFSREVETQLGRTEKGGNLPRTIDLDILLFDDIRFKGKTLEIPHPRMWQRDFVLEPLFEIAPELKNLKPKT